MTHVRRLSLLTLALAGCGKATPPPPVAVPISAPTATVGEVEPTSPSKVASAPANVARIAEKEPTETATHEIGSATAKAHPEQAKAMLAAAEQTWQATKASYDVGTTTLAHVHHWSKQLLLAERALADTKEEDLAALVAYWKRSKQTYLKIRALNNTGTRGGEQENFGAASFYLAEAELWLLDAGGSIPDSTD